MTNGDGLPDFSAPSKTPTTESSPEIGQVFYKAVQDLQKAMLNLADETMTVDMEMTFRSVTLSQKGIPLFTSKKTEQSFEIRLATRVHYSQP